MQEDHILDALRIFPSEQQKRQNIKIIWFAYFPTEDFIFSKIRQEYSNFDIKILNYNVYKRKSHKDNFEFAWTEFVNFIMKDDKVLSPWYTTIENVDIQKYTKEGADPNNLLNNLGDVSPNKVQRIVRDFFYLGKLNYEKIFDLKIRFPKTLLIDFIDFRVEKIEKSIIEKYLKKIEKITTEFLTFRYDYQKEANRILEHLGFQELLQKKEFKNFATQSIIFDLTTYKKINSYAYQNECVDLDLILRKRITLSQMPTIEFYIDFVNLLEKNFEKSEILANYQKPSIKVLMKLISDISLHYGKEYLILQTKRWKTFLASSFKNLLNHYDKLELNDKHRLFNLLYFTYYKNDNYKKDYLYFAKKQKDFLKYPSPFLIKGNHSALSRNFSSLDDQFIEDIEFFKNIKEAKEFVIANDKNNYEIKELFFKKLGGMSTPNNNKIKFVKELIKLWDLVYSYSWTFITRFKSIDLKLDNINEIYEIGSIVCNALNGNYEKEYPLSFRNKEIENAFMSQWERPNDLERILANDYKKFFFFKTNQNAYAGAYHFGEEWFLKGIKIAQSNNKIKKIIKKEIELYITNEELIKCILKEKQFPKPKNWDYLYFQYALNKNTSISEKDIVDSLKIKGEVVKDFQIKKLIKSIIYSRKIYENLKKFDNFVSEIKKIKDIPKTIKLIKKIKIYCLCRFKTKSDFKNILLFRNISEDIVDVLHVIKGSYEELNDEVLSEFIQNATSSIKLKKAIEPFWLISDIKLSNEIKKVIQVRVEKQINKIDLSYHSINWYIKKINNFLKKQAIEISKKSQKILEQKLSKKNG